MISESPPLTWSDESAPWTGIPPQTNSMPMYAGGYGPDLTYEQITDDVSQEQEYGQWVLEDTTAWSNEPADEYHVN